MTAGSSVSRSPQAKRHSGTQAFKAFRHSGFAADDSAWLVGITPAVTDNTLNVLDVDGRLLHTRSLPAGAALNVHLTATELGPGLRIVSLRGAQPWAGRVVLGQ